MEEWGRLLKEAERALLGGRSGEALRYCERAAVGGEEARYSASLLRGNILLEMGDAQGALRAFESVADPDAADPEIDCARGVALFELARFAEAEAALKSSIREAPHLAQSYYTLGLLAEFAGKGEEVRWFRQARELAPEKFAHHKQLRTAAFQSMLEDALTGLPAALAQAGCRVRGACRRSVEWSNFSPRRFRSRELQATDSCRGTRSHGGFP